LRLAHPLRTASALAEAIHPMVEGPPASSWVPETHGRGSAAALGCAEARARVCQGGTLLTGAPAAESDRRGGEPSGMRGALYSTGPRIGPRRMRELEAGLPSEEGGSEKVDTPRKGLESTWGDRV